MSAARFQLLVDATFTLAVTVIAVGALSVGAVSLDASVASLVALAATPGCGCPPLR